MYCQVDYQYNEPLNKKTNLRRKEQSSAFEFFVNPLTIVIGAWVIVEP